LKQRTTDLDVKKYAINLMMKSSSFDYTLNYLKRVEQQARDEVQRLGNNALLQGILDFLGKNL